MFLFVYQYTLHINLMFGYHLDIICPGCNLKNDARSVWHVGRRGEKETELHLTHDVDDDDDNVCNNIDIVQGVPKKYLIAFAFAQLLHWINQQLPIPLSGRGNTLIYSVKGLCETGTEKKILIESPAPWCRWFSIRTFFGGTLYIPSHCTPALPKAWSDTECSPCCGRRSRGCPPQSHSRRSRCPGFLSVWRSNLFWNWSSSLSPLWLFLCWKYKYEAQKTVVLNQMISLHLGDVQKSSLVKVDPKPEVFAAVKGTRLKCRVVPKKVN